MSTQNFSSFDSAARRNILGSETPLALVDFFSEIDLEKCNGRSEYRYRVYYGDRYANPSRFCFGNYYDTGYICVAYYGEGNDSPALRFCLMPQVGGRSYGIRMRHILLLEYASLNAIRDSGEDRVIYRHPTLDQTERNRGVLRMIDSGEPPWTPVPPIIEEPEAPRTRRRRRINLRKSRPN